jgi:hypothetical protein
MVNRQFGQGVRAGVFGKSEMYSYSGKSLPKRRFRPAFLVFPAANSD